MVRDFSEESKQKLLNMVKEVLPDGVFQSIGDWFGDGGLKIQKFFGGLNINKYLNDMDTYHRKMIDKDDLSAKQIEDIFNNVYYIDEQYKLTLANYIGYVAQLSTALQSYADGIKQGNLLLTNQQFLGTLYDSQSLSNGISELTKADSMDDIEQSLPYSLDDGVSLDDVWYIVDNFMDFNLSVGVAGGIEITKKVYHIPIFQVSSQDPFLLIIKNSKYYKGGSGGVRRIKIDNLKNYNNLNKAYNKNKLIENVSDKASKLERTSGIVGSTATGWSGVVDNLKDIKNIWKNTKTTKVGNVFIGLSGVVGFANEFQNGEYTTQRERVVDSTLEGAYALASAAAAAKIGAAAGTIAGPIGTVVGAAVGFGVGLGVGWLMDNAVHDIYIDGKSVMQWAKDGVNGAVDWVADVAAPAVGEAIGEVGRAINDTINNVKETASNVLSDIGSGLCGLGKAIFNF